MKRLGRLTRREKVFLAVGLLVIAPTLFWALVHEPLQGRLAAMAEELDSQTLALAKAVRLARDEDYGSRLRVLELEREELERAIPGQGWAVEFLRQAGTIQGKGGPRVLLVTFQPPVEEGPLLKGQATIELTGSLQGLARFLESLEGGGRPVRVPEVTARALEGKGPPVYQATVKVEFLAGSGPQRAVGPRP